MGNRPLVVLTGGVTTQALTEKLIGHFDVGVMDGQVAEIQHQKFGDRVIQVGKLITEESERIAQNEAVRRASTIFQSGWQNNLVGRLNATEEWKYSAPGKVVRELDNWLWGFLVASLARQLSRGFAINELERGRKISLFITHEDVTEVGGGLVQWANGKRIPTLHIPHANCYMMPECSPDLHETSISHSIAATPHMEQFYRERGYTGNIRITGSPIFDRWANFNVDRNWAAAALGLDPNVPTITYFSSWSQATNVHSLGEGFELAYRSILETVKRTGWQLLVKLHPGERAGLEQMYLEGAKQHQVICKVSRQYLDLFLSASDVIVTFGTSNTLLDAVLLGKQALSIRIRGFQIPLLPEVYLGSSVQEGSIVLKDKIESLLQNPQNASEAIKHYVGITDGHAVDRIAQWVKEIYL